MYFSDKDKKNYTMIQYFKILKTNGCCMKNILLLILIGALSLANASKTIDFVPTELILIKGGSYMMGSEKGKDDTRPVHKVTIGYDFYMDKYEVTLGQYKACVADGACTAIKDDVYYKKMCTDDDCPAMKVTWDDAKTYAQWLSKKSGKKYRLPSESEWEYAARAGTTTLYSFGDDVEDLDKYAWFGQLHGKKTKKIGMKKPNPWGLYDMHGNVWEWCEDSYSKDYTDHPTDGSAYEYNAFKVARGGSWYCPTNYVSSSYRFMLHKARASTKVGFRLVQEK